MISTIASLLGVSASRAIAQQSWMAFEDSQQILLTADEDLSAVAADAVDEPISSVFAETDGVLMAVDGESWGDGDGDGDGDSWGDGDGDGDGDDDRRRRRRGRGRGPRWQW